MYFSDSTAEWRILLHLRNHVGKEEHLSITGTRDEGVFGITSMLDEKAGIFEAALPAHAFKIALPALAVRRIRQHEIKLAGRKGIVRKRGVFRTANNVVSSFAIPFEEQIGLADCIR